MQVIMLRREAEHGMAIVDAFDGGSRSRAEDWEELVGMKSKWTPSNEHRLRRPISI